MDGRALDARASATSYGSKSLWSRNSIGPVAIRFSREVERIAIWSPCGLVHTLLMIYFIRWAR